MGIVQSSKEFLEKNGTYVAVGAAVSIAAVGAAKIYFSAGQSDDESASSSAADQTEVELRNPPTHKQIRQPPDGPENSCVGGEPAAMCSSCTDDPGSDQAREHALACIDSSIMEIMMVHSMKLDGTIKLGDSSYSDPTTAAMHQRVQATMKPLFWRMFNDKLKQGDLEPLVAEIEVIKKALIALNPKQEHVAKLNEALDVTLIKQMICHDALGAQQLGALVKFLVAEIKSFDMPDNDAATDLFERGLFQKLDCDGNIDMEALLPELLAWLNDKLQDVKLLRANYMLKLMQPVVEQQGAEIERDFVVSALAKKQMTLTRTKAWIIKHVDTSDIAKERIKLALQRGVLSLLGANVAATQNPEYPESLSLDTTRIEHMQNTLQLMALTAACFEELSALIEHDTMGAGIKMTPEQGNVLKVSLMQRLASPIQPMVQVQHFAQQFVYKLLEEHDKVKDKEVTKEIEELMQKVAWKAGAVCSPDNRVLPILLKRLLASFATLCMAEETKDAIDVMKASSPFAFKKFGQFECFESQLREILSMYRGICNLNYHVYYGMYRDLINSSDSDLLK